MADAGLKAIKFAKPHIHMNPDPAVSKDLLVSLPTWLWVDPSDLGMKKAQVIAGGVTVTGAVTATDVVWDTGDGPPFRCNGPGTPWTLGAVPGPQTCTHTYSKSSARAKTGTFTVTATITWRGTYTVTGAPGGGPLGPITETSSTTVSVAEAQAINNR
jgi:hypothetical protein